MIVFIPSHAPRGMRSAVRSDLVLSQKFDWITFRTSEEKPLDLLFGYFDESESAVLRNAFTLAHNKEFLRKVIWLEGVDVLTWDLWKEFFAEYAQVTQHIHPEEQTVFCVPLRAELARRHPLEDAMWSRYFYRGVTSNLDMLLFTSMMLDRSMPPLQLLVATSVIAKLAAWDPEVCLRLASAELKDILNPMTILGEIAASRGWSAPPPKSDFRSWEMGMTEDVDHKLTIHSATLVLRTLPDELNRRIWAAQMSVLLPIVEDARQMIIDKFGHQLKTPHPTGYGDIVDPRELEINHINAQIRRGTLSVDVEKEQLVRELTLIRNSLSHLKIVTADLLDSKVLNRFVRAQTEETVSYLQEIDDASVELDN